MEQHEQGCEFYETDCAGDLELTRIESCLQLLFNIVCGRETYEASLNFSCLCGSSSWGAPTSSDPYNSDTNLDLQMQMNATLSDSIFPPETRSLVDSLLHVSLEHNM